MKKLSLLICLLFSFSALAQCEKHYEKAAKKRVRTIKLVSYGVGLASPALVLLGGGVIVTTLAVTGMLGGLTSGKIHELNKRMTTFGKVNRALKGDLTLVAKRVERSLNKEGIDVDRNDPEFLKKIQGIIHNLNTSEKACPYIGYDKKFQDIVKVYSLKEFSRMVKEEYLNLESSQVSEVM